MPRTFVAEVGQHPVLKPSQCPGGGIQNLASLQVTEEKGFRFPTPVRKAEATKERKPKWKQKKGKRGTDSARQNEKKESTRHPHGLQTEAAVTPFTNRNFPLIKAKRTFHPIAC